MIKTARKKLNFFIMKAKSACLNHAKKQTSIKFKIQECLLRAIYIYLSGGSEPAKPEEAGRGEAVTCIIAKSQHNFPASPAENSAASGKS
jgi:hypothetical protein